jgi:hypothetical protein
VLGGGVVGNEGSDESKMLVWTKRKAKGGRVEA